MERVCILDYGSGNVGSVYNMLNFMGVEVAISRESAVIEDCSHLILPGVGAFNASMSKCLNTLPMDIVRNEVISKGKPYLGICVGMQLLATSGDEGGGCDGLNWIEGHIRKLECPNLHIPHVGWNSVTANEESILLDGINGENFYFIHSYCFDNRDDCLVGTTDYGEEISSLLEKDNVFGVQFHPEKSQHAGFALLNNFLRFQ